MNKKSKVGPKVKVEWTGSDGICTSNDYEIFAPKGYVLEVQMDHCGCRPYHVKLVEDKPKPSGCLLHEVGKECPLVGPDRHCGQERCTIDTVNPFREGGGP